MYCLLSRFANDCEQTAAAVWRQKHADCAAGHAAAFNVSELQLSDVQSNGSYFSLDEYFIIIVSRLIVFYFSPKSGVLCECTEYVFRCFFFSNPFSFFVFLKNFEKMIQSKNYHPFSRVWLNEYLF